MVAHKDVMKREHWTSMGETYEDRQAAVELMFNHLDKDDSGSISLIELTRIARAVNPVANMNEAREMLGYMDTDGDGEVSKEEFARSMNTLVTGSTPEQFDAAVREVLFREIPADGRYVHPEANKEYLQKTVLPTLTQGMEELVQTIEKDRLRTASWADFSDGYLPDNWLTFQVLEALADYLQHNNPAYSHDTMAPKNWNELTREEKLELVFRHLDRDGSDSLTQDELVAVASQINPKQDKIEARKQLEWMDADGDQQVSLGEFQESMSFLMKYLDDAEFEAGVQKMLASTHLSYFSRDDKIKMVFDHLDRDGSGTLSVEELMELALALNPKGDVVAAKKTISYMDQDGDKMLTRQEFQEALEKMSDDMNDEAFDMGIHKLLTAEQEQVVPPDPLEGLQQKLRAVITKSPNFATTKQIGCIEAAGLYEGQKKKPDAKVLWVDCRSWDEVLVSTVPGAVHYPVTISSHETLESDAANVAKWFFVAGDDEMAKDLPNTKPGTAAKGGKGGKGGKASADATPAAGPLAPGQPKPPVQSAQEITRQHIIVCMDTIGTKSELLAAELEKRLGMQVFNLTGGIIQWFNTNGDVEGYEKEEPVKEEVEEGKKPKTPKTPKEPTYTKKMVECLHPHHKRFIGFVKRKNKFNVKAWIQAQKAAAKPPEGQKKKGKK